MGIVGLCAPILFIINCVFILFWLAAKKIIFTIPSIVAIVITWQNISVLFACNFFAQNKFDKHKNSFTIMSYNVRLLDLYHWNKDKNTREEIIKFIQQQSPDILCLQEFYTSSDSSLDNIYAIMKAGNYTNYTSNFSTNNKRGKWGSIVFSRYPLLNNLTPLLSAQSKNTYQSCMVYMPNDTVMIYNVHFKSVKLDTKETQLLSDKNIPSIADSNLERTKSIYSKLITGFTYRGNESDVVHSDIAQSKYPTIVCGDLNDLPSSYVYFNVRGNLNDVFLDKGVGLGGTHHSISKALRIDYIFYSKQNFTLDAYKKFEVPFSDHFPLLAQFSTTKRH